MDFFTSDRAAFMLIAILAHDGPLVAYHLVCKVLRNYHICDQYLIQHCPPPPDLVSKAIRQLAFGHFVLQIPLLWVMFDIFNWNGMSGLRSELPELRSIASQIFFFMVVCDTCLYWAHRSLHHRLLYTMFHKQHHSFKENLIRYYFKTKRRRHLRRSS